MAPFSADSLAWLQTWLSQYSYFALFFLLALGIIGLPIPEDALIAFCGIMIAKGKLMLLPTAVIVFIGSVCGISVSYCLGRTLGHYLLVKYGRWIWLHEKHIQAVHDWFEHLGKWTLCLGYFVPGVRHLTGYIAGTARLNFKSFALFAYSGAAVWVSSLLSLGYFFGTSWEQILDLVERNALLSLIIALFLIVSYIFWEWRKRKWRKKL